MSVIVIHGPPGTGKTANAAAFAKAYGAGMIIDDGIDRHQKFPRRNAVVLTTRSPSEVHTWRRQSLPGATDAEEVTFVTIVAALERIGIVQDIARGLTPAMKRVVLRGGLAAGDNDGTIRALMRRRLLRVVAGRELHPSPRCGLTTLGYAVKKHLQGAAAKNDRQQVSMPAEGTAP